MTASQSKTRGISGDQTWVRSGFDNIMPQRDEEGKAVSPTCAVFTQFNFLGFFLFFVFKQESHRIAQIGLELTM